MAVNGTYNIRHLTICCLLLSCVFLLIHLKLADYTLAKPRYTESTLHRLPKDSKLKHLISRYEQLPIIKEQLLKDIGSAMTENSDDYPGLNRLGPHADEEKVKPKIEGEKEGEKDEGVVNQLIAPPVQTPPVKEEEVVKTEPEKVKGVKKDLKTKKKDKKKGKKAKQKGKSKTAGEKISQKHGVEPDYPD